MRSLIIIMLSILSISCSSTGFKEKRRALSLRKDAYVTIKPEWSSIKGYRKSKGRFLFKGEASGLNNSSDAKAAALADALAKVSNYFGIRVQSGITVKQEESNKDDSYYIGVKSVLTGQPIMLKSYREIDSFEENIHAESGVKFNALILIAVPLVEIERLKIVVEGKTGWGFIGFTTDQNSFATEVVKTIAKKKKLALAAEALPLSAKDNIATLKEKSKNAYFIKLTSSVSEPQEIDTKWFSNVKITVDILSLVDGEILHSFTAEEKGSAHSKSDAVTNGFKKVREIILSKI